MGRKEEEAARRVFWCGHVDAWRASGETQREYCARHGLKRHSLSYWQLRFTKETLGEQRGSEAVPMPLTLVRAERVPAMNELRSEGVLTAKSPSGWTLMFAALPPADWLAELSGGRA